MADTGAPWNIPYVENADLVKDYPTASLALANAVADGLDEASLIKQVVQTVKTDTFTTTSGTFTVVTGLSASITPASATSKVLIIAQISYGTASSASYGHFKVTRGGTDIYVGDISGANRIEAVFGGYSNSADTSNVFSGTIVYLDSPASASSVTYQVETRRGVNADQVSVNRSNGWPDDANQTNAASSITLIEVAQ